jgi:transposase
VTACGCSRCRKWLLPGTSSNRYGPAKCRAWSCITSAKPLLWNLRKAFPQVKLAWADGGYAGKLVTWARTKLKPKLTLQIVKRPDDLHTFQVLPRRWVVERTLAWITRNRRTVRDYERLPAHHETYVYWSMVIVMTRRLARNAASTSVPAQSDAA